MRLVLVLLLVLVLVELDGGAGGGLATLEELGPHLESDDGRSAAGRCRRCRRKRAYRKPVTNSKVQHSPPSLSQPVRPGLVRSAAAGIGWGGRDRCIGVHRTEGYYTDAERMSWKGYSSSSLFAVSSLAEAPCSCFRIKVDKVSLLFRI